MTREDELGGILKAAFEREVETMSIDVGAGARRLQKELDPSARSRSRGRAMAALVLIVGTVVGWTAWSSQRDAMPVAPAPLSSASQRITPVPSEWPYLLDLRTGEQAPLPNSLVPGGPHIGTVYAILPGMRLIAVSSCRLSTMGCTGPSTAFVASLDGGGDVRPLRIPGGLVTQTVEWSPDGARLLYAASDGSFNAVGEYYLYDLGSDRSTRITDIPLEGAWWWSTRSSFSADGRSVLYDLPRTGAEATGWDVWSVPVTGGPAKVFLRDAKAPKAIPGGSSVAFLTPKPGVWGGSALAIVDDSGSRRVLVETKGEIGWLYVSPDGTRIAYNDWPSGEISGEGGTWVVDIATGQRTRVAAGDPGPWLDDHTILVLP